MNVSSTTNRIAIIPAVSQATGVVLRDVRITGENMGNAIKKGMLLMMGIASAIV
jgi:hypothetical protein